jgi:hypothetical protein
MRVEGRPLGIGGLLARRRCVVCGGGARRAGGVPVLAWVTIEVREPPG